MHTALFAMRPRFFATHFWRLTWAGLTLLITASASNAADLDCLKPRSTMNKTICQNPTLLKLDADLTHAYSIAKNKLSPTAAKKLAQSQVNWRVIQARRCFFDFNAQPLTPFRSAECLTLAYQMRILRLETAGEMIGSFKTYPMTEYRSDFSPAKQLFYLFQHDYVLADMPTSDQTKRLNAFLGPENHLNGPHEEHSNWNRMSGYETFKDDVTLVSPDWLQRASVYQINLGDDLRVDNGQICTLYSLSKNTMLMVADIFKSDAWKQIAIKQTESYFKKLAKQDKDIDIAMVDYASFNIPWTGAFPFCVSAEGFTVTSLIPFSTTVPWVTLGWNHFASVLTPEAQAHIRQIPNHERHTQGK